MSDPVIDSLLRAVQSAPEDTTLRLLLAERLVGADRPDEAVQHCATVLGQEPGNARARELMQQAISRPASGSQAETPSAPQPPAPASPPVAPGSVQPPEAPRAAAHEPHREPAGPDAEETGGEPAHAGDPEAPVRPSSSEQPARGWFSRLLRPEPAPSPRPGAPSPGAPSPAVPGPATAPSPAPDDAAERGPDGEPSQLDTPGTSPAVAGTPAPPPASPWYLPDAAAAPAGDTGREEESDGADPEAGAEVVAPDETREETPTERRLHEADFDWDAAEADLPGAPAKMFVTIEEKRPDFWEVERPKITLDDVGGLRDVKDRLDLSFLGPMRNPELRRLYGKSLRGGLLLYGPPGCGKTYIARAVAGELGAKFINVAIHDVLDSLMGRSEANIHELFMQGRREKPCVLFIDEIDALGAKRTSQSSVYLRTVLNQMLTELDGIEADNDGLFVLAATNHPWDVDTALRRPGRFDRSVAVLPPDAEARAAIFRHHLKDRPIEGVDVDLLATKTDGFTGADIALVCEGATEIAMRDGMRTGTVRLITMTDLLTSLGGTRPSTDDWFTIARNVVQFGDHSGQYADLMAYMQERNLL